MHKTMALPTQKQLVAENAGLRAQLRKPKILYMPFAAARWMRSSSRCGR